MSDNPASRRKRELHKKGPSNKFKYFALLGIVVFVCLLIMVLSKFRPAKKDFLFYDYNLNKIVVAENIIAIENKNVKFSHNNSLLEYYFEYTKDESISDYDFKVDNDTIEWIKLDKEKGVIVVKTKRPIVFEATINTKTNEVYLAPAELRDKYDKIVMLDAGHGGEDTGAIVNGINEKDINIAVIKKVYELLENSDAGIKAYLTHYDDETVPLADRPFIGNDFADLFVSVHCNTYEPSDQPHGTQTHYDQFSDINTGRTDLANKEFAEIMQRNVLQQLGSYDRGRMGDDEFFVLVNSTMPAVLIELGYMTNPNELAMLTDESYQDLAAQGIYNGIVEAFEEYRITDD